MVPQQVILQVSPPTFMHFPLEITTLLGSIFWYSQGLLEPLGLPLPVTPDLTTTNLAMGRLMGKVALANIATALGCGATTTPCTLPHPNIVILLPGERQITQKAGLRSTLAQVSRISKVACANPVDVRTPITTAMISTC